MITDRLLYARESSHFDDNPSGGFVASGRRLRKRTPGFKNRVSRFVGGFPGFRLLARGGDDILSFFFKEFSREAPSTAYGVCFKPLVELGS